MMNRISLLPFRCVSLEQKLTELLQTLYSAHFVVQLRVDGNVEIVIDLSDLSEVLLLHLATGDALLARAVRVWEKNLVDYDVVNVDFLFCQLASQSFCFVHREELWDAHCDERCLLRVFELLAYFFNLSLKALHRLEKVLLHIASLASHHSS